MEFLVVLGFIIWNMWANENHPGRMAVCNIITLALVFGLMLGL
ncbi:MULTISPECIES: hypothetical protein [Halorhodospira]|nr:MULTISPECIES: hypothetical protein [Halorhodospira]